MSVGKSDNREHTGWRDPEWSKLCRQPGVVALGPPIQRKPGCKHIRFADADSASQMICDRCGLPMILFEVMRPGDYRHKGTRYTIALAAAVGCQAYLVIYSPGDYLEIRRPDGNREILWKGTETEFIKQLELKAKAHKCKNSS
jgi:hypothetical protein